MIEVRVLICNSKNWFSLDNITQKNNEVKVVSQKEELSNNFLQDFQPDFIFFVHWNWIVSKKIYEHYTCIVFHTAPLPYGRGGSPIQNLILDGFDSSPVCALRMTGELDAGPIYSTIEISLSGSLGIILSRISDVINHLIVEIIDGGIEPKQQQGETYVFKRLNESDNEIPKNVDLKQIYDRIRMLDHEDYPNAFITYGDVKLEFFNPDYKDKTVYLTCKITKSP